MTLGTHVRLPDGRIGTVVFNGLVGVGIKWGIHEPAEEDFAGTTGDLFKPTDDSPARMTEWPWQPDAMLREDSLADKLGLPCVGEVFEVLDT